jgi:hypothetical protein
MMTAATEATDDCFFWVLLLVVGLWLMWGK